MRRRGTLKDISCSVIWTLYFIRLFAECVTIAELPTRFTVDLHAYVSSLLFVVPYQSVKRS